MRSSLYAARVFSVFAVVVEVENAAVVQHDVLEHRAERTRRREDLRFRLLREPDYLRVAAALEVEHPAIAPAVLVVTDQGPLRVCRERRLARPGETEEDGHLLLGSDVRRAVHREDALERQAVVHQREDRLLDLPGVVRPADHDLQTRGMEADERLRARAVLVRIGRHRRGVEDQGLRLHLLELRLRWIDEERLREERVPGALADHAHGDAVSRIGAREGVDDVDVALAEPQRHLVAEPLEVLLGELAVDVTPPDPPLGTGLADDELVLRGAPRVHARVDDERAAFGKPRLASGERVLVELRGRGVPVDIPAHGDPVLRELVPVGNDRDHEASSYAHVARPGRVTGPQAR